MGRPRTWTDEGKVCKGCGEFKPLSEYYVYNRDTGTPNVFARCKPCSTAKNREWRSTKPGVARKHNLLRRYGLTEQEYDDLLVSQGGGCAICGGSDLLSVDHCHDTGRVRGILCRRHNAGLGNFDDDPDLLRRALDYLTT